MPKVNTRASCARDFHCCPDIGIALESSCKAGYDFVCLPMVNPRFKREFINGPAKNRKCALTRSDMCLTSQDWNTLVVGKISPWLHIDSDYYHTRTNSELAFKEELTWAAHLGLPAVMMPLRSGKCFNLARCLNEYFVANYYQQQYWVQVPLLSPAAQCDQVIEGLDENMGEDKSEDTWSWWNTLRSLCDHNKRLCVALELTADLPDREVVERWMSEPVKAILVSTSLFLTNKKGYPVLSKLHQSVIKDLFKLEVQVIITGQDRHPDKTIRAYQQYIDHLWQTQDPLDTVSQFAKGYEDFLQSPLQPLMDNLESQTYEIFEKDPIKYSQYQKAVYHALLDRVPLEDRETTEIVIMVVGAGRGPLVRASIAAAIEAGCKLKKVYAVEKNPNAVITLENMKEEEWGSRVEVVSCDMRDWVAPEKADILVSELLGSFGDNELSPECLDGAQKYLKDDGISIPEKYTSFLAPLQSSKLYNEVRSSKAERGKPPEAPFEMPYVVRLHNCSVLDTPKPVFTFTHPNREEAIDNCRYASLDFTVQQDALVHGFAGYFDTNLYKDVMLSIVPETHSPGMFSWFPILFPIRVPITMTKGSTISIDIWRRCTSKNVWYEWAFRCGGQVSPIHNPKGRSYTIGL
ncbi:protein arginine N-methyltransferase 5 [Aplysia californica]|uniref:Protein arginine N-methyltransferase n=1 Tax=Aplysia californica TaxID=6500 RepID=A0ABM0JU70_APLCA|nr:protein arginine N-methyltransferase 5 [Aplysia californica]